MKTLVCSKCKNEVQADDHQTILTCDRIWSPYKKKDQTTTVIKYTHGVGVEGKLGWITPLSSL